MSSLSETNTPGELTQEVIIWLKLDKNGTDLREI